MMRYADAVIGPVDAVVLLISASEAFWSVATAV